MTDQERASLPSLLDQVVTLETVEGDRLVVRVLFVFDEGQTPDLFCVEVVPGLVGDWVEKGTEGLSILLADIVRVSPVIRDSGESNQ